jgi:hypothetical protein
LDHGKIGRWKKKKKKKEREQGEVGLAATETSKKRWPERGPARRIGWVASLEGANLEN